MPKVTLHIPTPLRRYTDGQARLPLEADSVRAALTGAGERYPDLRHQLLTREGAVRPYVNVFLRQQDIRQLDGLDTSLVDGDEIIVMPSVAGG